jgi:PIN domain nuclease of toxin-antitoxin system
MLLLDTCTFLWLVSRQSELSATARNLIDKNSNNLFISSITAFEIGVKHEKGRLKLPLPPRTWIGSALEFHGILDIPITWHIAVHATELPDLHDRIIISTSQINRMEILTPDRLIHQYPDVDVIW